MQYTRPIKGTSQRESGVRRVWSGGPSCRRTTRESRSLNGNYTTKSDPRSTSSTPRPAPRPTSRSCLKSSDRTRSTSSASPRRNSLPSSTAAAQTTPSASGRAGRFAGACTSRSCGGMTTRKALSRLEPSARGLGCTPPGASEPPSTSPTTTTRGSFVPSAYPSSSRLARSTNVTLETQRLVPPSRGARTRSKSPRRAPCASLSWTSTKSKERPPPTSSRAKSASSDHVVGYPPTESSSPAPAGSTTSASQRPSPKPVTSSSRSKPFAGEDDGAAKGKSEAALLAGMREVGEVVERRPAFDSEKGQMKEEELKAFCVPERELLLAKMGGEGVKAEAEEGDPVGGGEVMAEETKEDLEERLKEVKAKLAKTMENKKKEKELFNKETGEKHACPWCSGCSSQC